MKILVIEDDPEIAGTLSDILGLNGHLVTTATDGDSGLRQLQSRPDLVFCDVGLPGMNGFDLLRTARQQPHLNDIPFIFLTALSDHESRRRGMNLGADDYLTKPFREHEILDAINATTLRQEQLRKRVAELLADQRSERGANWSHELMTPLNGIFGALQLFEEAPDMADDERAEMLGIIRSCAQSQYELARRLVLHFDLDSQTTDTAPRHPADAAATARAAALRVSSAHRRANDLRIDVAPGLIAASDFYLADVLAELIDNAFKFSRSGQAVEVRGSIIDDSYVFEVTDQGQGFAESEFKQVRAFTQFARPGFVRQGLGLGLAIARSFARLAEGRLEATSPPGHSGTAMKLALPLAQADSPEPS